METSLSLLDRLAGAPTDDDWRRLLDLYQPSAPRLDGAGGRCRRPTPTTCSRRCCSSSSARWAASSGAARGVPRPGCEPSSPIGCATISAQPSIGRPPPATAISCAGSTNWRSPESALSRLWGQRTREHVAASLLRRVEGDFAPATWQAFRRHVLDRGAGRAGRRGAGPVAELRAARQEPRPQARAARTGRLG